MFGTLHKRDFSVKPSMDMQLVLADKAAGMDEDDKFMQTSSSLPSLGTSCVPQGGLGR